MSMKIEPQKILCHRVKISTPPRHKANNNLTYLAKFSRESVKTREINNHVN
uniref:Uncharacterized protein n=1 Tax=Anguilla anguilla TaxID=7936 RepID=A0A0E9R3R2_ANGAN